LQVLFTHRFVQHRARAIVALLALAVVAFVLAACGGSDSGGGSGGSSADAETLLRQTFTGTHDIRSGQADIQLRVDVSGDASIRGPISLSISGPFQSVGSDELPKFDMALDANAQGQGFRAGLTSTSDQLFVNFGGTAYEVPADLLNQLKDSYRRSQQSGSSDQQMSLESLGLDPLSWLQDPTVEGTETIDGVETDHISSKVNVNALLDDVDTILARVSAQGLPTGQQVPDRIPADARSQIEDAVKGATINIWSGKDDHTLRKLTLALSVDIPRQSTSLDVNLSIELSDLNQPQSISAPASSRPLNELLGQLQGFLGGALGGGSLGGGSSGGAGGTNSQQLQAYSDCIQRAGSNVQEAQKCADLLTQ
jgi:hypothetical protein